MKCCVTIVTGPAGGLDYSTEKTREFKDTSDLYAAIATVLLRMPGNVKRVLIEGEVIDPQTAKRKEPKTKHKKKR